jgi:putative copper resistance protein D
MAGLVDVLLRGAILALASLVLGGVVWTRVVLRAGPGAAPAPPVALALRIVGGGASALALAQAGTLLVALAALRTAEGWPLAELLATTFARTALGRIALALALAGLALRLARRVAAPMAWHALGAGALVLVAASAVLSHAVARVEDRALLLLLDAAHQVVAAVWIGGLAHLTVYARFRARQGRRPRAVGAGVASPGQGGSDDGGLDPGVIRRFSDLAVGAVVVLIAASVILTWRYVGDWAGLAGTAYGVMVLSKVLVLVAILGLAALNFRAVRRVAGADHARLLGRVEVELGLGLTVFFVAASLTSLPPAIDLTTDRATVAEVVDRFRPAPPRLTSPPVAELVAKAEPLMAPVTRREEVERAWSEYNHHWAGFFVLTMGTLAALERAGVRAARHWPLLFLGLAGFLSLRSDPRAWPRGPAGFWESFTLPDVLQHRAFTALIVAFAVFEWLVRTGRLPVRPWGYVFPLLCAVGGGLLLTHSHAMFSLKDEFLIEVTHAPIGLLGAFAGWARWLELRLPGAGRAPGWCWTGCLIAVGLILIVYREA